MCWFKKKKPLINEVTSVVDGLPIRYCDACGKQLQTTGTIKQKGFSIADGSPRLSAELRCSDHPTHGVDYLYDSGGWTMVSIHT